MMYPSPFRSFVSRSFVVSVVDWVPVAMIPLGQFDSNPPLVYMIANCRA